VLLVVAVILALAGLLVGIQELYPIAAAAVVLVAAARLWVGSRQIDVQVVRHVRPARVPAGAGARVELSVANHSVRRSAVLSARDPFDGGKRWARFLIAPLEPDEVRFAAYGLPTMQRGVFQLGPLELELSDPFGLAHVVTVASGSSTLTVHPKVEPLRSRQVAAQPDTDTKVPLPVIGQVGDEFYGLREYRPGDDLRRVHWVSTARLDQLIIRQPENLLRGRLTVAVDLRAPLHDAMTLEAALSAAASILTAAQRERVHVRLVTSAGADTGFGGTYSHCATALDLLAAAKVHRGTTLTDELHLGAGTGPLVLITTQWAGEGDLAGVLRSGGRDGATVVVFERSPSGDLSGVLAHRLSHCRYVTVRAGGSFQRAWEGVPC
jgi:uncharacterized protein (DUF58 family)